MSDNLFWRNRIVDSGAADPQELAKGYNPDNWRFHPQIQRDALEDALDSIGVLQPVLFNRLSGKVIDGHLRIELAILKGQPLIPVNYVELTDDEEALALATLDAITEQAEPIPDKLAALLARTREMTADRPGLGAMLQKLKERAGINGHQKTEEGPPPIDKAAELQKVWGVKVGDVWELGQHRLVCGDCTDRATVEAVMRGERAEACITDPPYGVGKDYEGEDLTGENFASFHSLWLANVCGLVDDEAPFYIFFGCKNLFAFTDVLREFIKIRLLIWHRPDSHGAGGSDYYYNFDPILYGSRNGRKSRFEFADFARDVWTINKAQPTGGGFEHPTVKPLAVIEQPLKASTQRDAIIVDFFLGSGTTLIACEQLGRRCRGVEIDPSYCSVTLERWSQLTGQTPRRVSG